MASKRDRNASIRKKRNTIRRRVIFVVVSVLPLVVGLIWYGYANKIIDQVNGYNTQATIINETETSREALNYNLKAASQGYIDGEGLAMLSALEELNPGYKNALAKVTTTHAPGTAELQASIEAYTAEAKPAVDLALSPQYTAAGVDAIVNSAAFKEADEQVALSIAAAHLGLSGATHDGNDNWKFVLFAELVITLFLTILAVVLCLITERAIRRREEIEAARQLDRISPNTEPFTHVIASMNDGVLVVSDEQKITHANPRAQALFGMAYTVGSTFTLPAPTELQIAKPDGSSVNASLTSSTAVSGGQPVTIVTVREQ